MIVTIMQPAYLPWLGYFHRIALSDLFIVLDHVQIDRNSKSGFAHRNKVRTPDGWCWLTVPLQTKGKHGELYLNQVAIANDQAWAAKHWATLRHNYSRAPFFAHHAGALEQIYQRPWERLADLSREITSYLLDAFGIRTPVRYSSTLGMTSTKDQLILDLCQQAGASIYVSGPFGRDYLAPESFQASNIEVVYHDYSHPQYPQIYAGFEPYMGALDLLLNCGPESRQILHSGNAEIEQRLRAERPTRKAS